MKRTSIKVLAIVVALAMIFATLPATAFAAPGVPSDEAPAVHFAFYQNYTSTDANIISQNNTTAGDILDLDDDGTPSRTGYTFAGWYLTRACDGAVAISADGTIKYTISEDTEFFAKWTASNVTVNFSVDGGTAVASYAGKFDGLVEQPASPEKAGRTFAGWYKEAALTNAWNFSSDKLSSADAAAGAVTLYAKWTGVGPGALEKTIYFVSNLQSFKQITATEGSKITEPSPAPVRAGYTFGGWLKSDGTTLWNFAVDTVPAAATTTLTAKWTAIVYTVTYEEIGGTTVADATSSYNGDSPRTIGDLPAVTTTKAGFVFGGWYYDAAFATKALAADKITANITLFAKWLDKYNLTYHKNDGSANDILGFTQNVTAGNTVGAADVGFPTRSGYVSPTKWYSDAACTTEFKFGGAGVGTPVNGNVDLYVKWVADTDWTVSFDSQGGSAVEAIAVSPTGSKTVAKPADPVRAGYTFVKWQLAGADFKFAGETGANIVSASITLTAVWAKNAAYRITYIADGAVYDAKDYAAGQTYTIPAEPVKAGYTFKGWDNDSTLNGEYDLRYAGDHSGLGQPYTDRTVSANLIWYGWFTQNDYTVSFSTARGVTPASQTLHYDDLVATPAAPVANGYQLDGWYTGQNGTGTKWNFATMKITGSMTLYANWIPLFTVTLVKGATTDTLQAADAVFGDAVSNYVPGTNDVVVASGSKLIAPDYAAAADQQNPTLANYTFVGWFKDSINGSQWTFGENGDAVTANVTLYAKYTKNKDTMTFLPKNGSAAIVKSIDFDVTSVEVDNPSMPGFTFAGWSVDDDGNVATAGDQAAGANGKTTVDEIAATAADDIYYAVWTKNDVTALSLTYRKGYDDGATLLAVNNILSTSAVASGTSVTSLPTISRTGYTFVSWVVDTDSDGIADGGEIAVALPLNVTAATNLVAKWSINSYTITYDSVGGNAVASDSASYDSTIAAPAAPSKPGYTFGGWYKEPSCVNAWVFTGSANADKVVSSITLYARWLTVYTVAFYKDGSLVHQALITSGQKVPDATDDTFCGKAGYTFNGWFTQASGGTLFMASGSDSSAVTANLNVFAQYTVIPAAEFTVTFDSNGGSFVANQKVVTGGKAVAPVAPLLAGSVFKQWELAGAAYDFNTAVTGNITLVAAWEADKTISIYSLDDGFVTSYTSPYNSSIIAPPTPATSANFQWNGKWYTSAARTTEFIFANAVKANVTLYPGIIGKKTVAFTANYAGGPAIQSQKLVSGTHVAEPTVTRDGYILEGWYILIGGSAVGAKWDFATNVVGTDDITLSAKWVYAYTVTYNMNYAGSTNNAVKSMYNRKVTKPADPVREGFGFRGWFTDAACQYEWDFETRVLTRNTVLFAKWVDTLAPVITIAPYATNPTNKDITVTATTNEGTLNFSSHTFTENGSFTFVATDAAGNKSEVVINITNIDKVAPAITIKPYTTALTNKDIIVYATVSGGTLNVASKTFTANGSFTFVATDAAGNVSSKVVRITNIDKVKPVITVKNSKGQTIAKSGTTVRTSYLKVAITETNLLSKAVTRNGRTITWPSTGKFTSKGTYIFTVKDKAGNVSTFKVILK